MQRAQTSKNINQATGNTAKSRTAASGAAAAMKKGDLRNKFNAASGANGQKTKVASNTQNRLSSDHQRGGGCTYNDPRTHCKFNCAANPDLPHCKPPNGPQHDAPRRGPAPPALRASTP
jgi:hypothetical protein